MFGRIALLAALLTGGLAFAESQAATSPAPAPKQTEPLAAPARTAETRTSCPKVKVVYAGHGEAERAGCRPAH